MKERIPNVPPEIIFAVKFLFYFFLFACAVYLLAGPTPSEPVF